MSVPLTKDQANYKTVETFLSEANNRYEEYLKQKGTTPRKKIELADIQVSNSQPGDGLFELSYIDSEDDFYIDGLISAPSGKITFAHGSFEEYLKNVRLFGSAKALYFTGETKAPDACQMAVNLFGTKEVGNSGCKNEVEPDEIEVGPGERKIRLLVGGTLLYLMTEVSLSLLLTTLAAAPRLFWTLPPFAATITVRPVLFPITRTFIGAGRLLARPQVAAVVGGFLVGALVGVGLEKAQQAVFGNSISGLAGDLAYKTFGPAKPSTIDWFDKYLGWLP